LEKLSSNESQSRPGNLIAIALTVLVCIYFLVWILRLYPTLINDEYSALDFVYRSITTGEFTPPPHRFYKPYSLIFGLLAFAGGPLAYETLAVLFAAGLVYVFYLCARQRLGAGFALLAAAMLGLAPDFFDITVQAIAIAPGTFFIFLAVYCGNQLRESPGKWKQYSFAAFLGGLARPENWLLAFPLVGWLFPKYLKQVPRWIAAPAIIALSALIWFGKDYFLAHDVMYSLKVARYDKMIGTGAPFGLGMSLYWFHHFLGPKFWTPFEIMAVLGFFLYAWDHRRTLLQDPMFITPVMLFLFLYLSIWKGLYPQMRFFFPLSAFLIFFLAWLFERIFKLLRQKSHAKPAWAAVCVLAAGYFIWAFLRLHSVELKSLKRESAVQKETVALAQYFRPLLTTGGRRIMLSERRDDQFSWLLRDLPQQDYIAFREVHYYARFEGKNFLDSNPEWIVWLANDYQYRGVNDMFQWLSYQDRTETSGRSIILEKTIGDYRVFKVEKSGPDYIER
jgi:hypothetical protein